MKYSSQSRKLWLKLYFAKLQGVYMSKRLENKSVILIGASKGIGKGIAQLFAQEGAQLLLVGRSEPLLLDLVDTLESQGYSAQYSLADISDELQIQRAVDMALKIYGRIDVLCQNAGIYPKARLEEMTTSQWDKVIGTNLTGTFYALKACLPAMKAQKKGKIVITSSISGPKVGLPGHSHYTASKAGILGLIRTAAIELAKYNITVNSVEPGNIITEGLIEGAQGNNYLSEMEQAIPMGRLGTPEDIAYAALFLATDESKFMTGQSLVVDGGQTLPESHYSEF